MLGRRVRLAISLPSVSRLYRKYGALDVYQACSPPLSVSGGKALTARKADNVPAISEPTI
jgi:hypothetical protein